jgi:hypothetical protein
MCPECGDTAAEWRPPERSEGKRNREPNPLRSHLSPPTPIWRMSPPRRSCQSESHTSWACTCVRRHGDVPPPHRIALADQSDFRYSTRSAFCAAERLSPNSVS